jgi:hypothetical protein
MFGHTFFPETMGESHQVRDPSRKFEAEFRGQPVKEFPGRGKVYVSPQAVAENLGLSPGAERTIAGWVKFELARSENELDFRRGLVNRLLESRYDPTLRRAIMDRAMSLYQSTNSKRRPRFTARRQLLPESYSNRVPQTLIPRDLSKGSQRGGTYHRRIPKPGGGYKYIYSPVDDEPSGHEARRIALGKRVRRIIDKAGPDGCPAELLRELADQHGARTIAELVQEHGDFEIRDGRVRYLRKSIPAKSQADLSTSHFATSRPAESLALSKGQKVAPQGAGGAGGGSEGSPPGTRKVWGNRVVEKQPDGRWKVVSHVAGFEGERVPRKTKLKPGVDDPAHPVLDHKELTREQADHLIEQLKEQRGEK